MARISTKLNQTSRDMYYSIGTDKTKNLKERIAEVHGADSETMKAVDELDRYESHSETKNSP